MNNGDIYLGNYKGWYSIRDENFISENEIFCVTPKWPLKTEQAQLQVSVNLGKEV